MDSLQYMLLWLEMELGLSFWHEKEEIGLQNLPQPLKLPVPSASSKLPVWCLGLMPRSQAELCFLLFYVSKNKPCSAREAWERELSCFLQNKHGKPTRQTSERPSHELEVLLRFGGGRMEPGSWLPAHPRPHEGSPRTGVVGATDSALGTVDGVCCMQGK